MQQKSQLHASWWNGSVAKDSKFTEMNIDEL